MYIVDQKVAWIGGINLFDDAFEQIDIMVKLVNKKIIKELIFQFIKMRKQAITRDTKKHVENNYTLFFDAGKKGKSIIYDRAIELIQKSKKSLVFVSPFFPDGQLLKQLINASKRDVKVFVLTSPMPNKYTHITDKISFLFFQRSIKNSKHIKLIHAPKYIHAKLLLIDGEVAFWGSHNLTYAGVLLGTSEIMIETTNTQIVNQIKKFSATYLRK